MSSFTSTARRPSARGLDALPPGLTEDRHGGFRWIPTRKYRKANQSSVRIKRADGTVVTDLEEALPIYWSLIAQIDAGMKIASAVDVARNWDTLVALYRTKVFDHPDALEQKLFADSYRRDQNRHLKVLSQPDFFGGLSMDELMVPGEMRARLKIEQKKRGIAQGFKLFGTARLIMEFGKRETWVPSNPLMDMKGKSPDKLIKPKGRISIWTLEEIVAFIRLAQWLGLPSQAHFIVLAVCTGQSVRDVLGMPRLGEPLLSERGGFWVHKRYKTDITAFMPASKLALHHIAQMEREQEALWPGRSFETQLIYERTGKPYVYEQFREINEAIRTLLSGDLKTYNATPRIMRLTPDKKLNRLPVLRKVTSLSQLPVAPVPSIATKWPSDLRDTAVSRIIKKTGSELIPTLTSGHASAKATRDRDDKNEMIRGHYWEKDGEPVLQALGAWDDIYDALYPSLRVVKKVA